MAEESRLTGEGEMKKILSAAMMKTMSASLAVLILLSSSSAAGKTDEYKWTDREIMNQVSLLQGLTFGDYTGSVSVGWLKELGDTGIGTFDALNGELIMLGGEVYRAAYDGTLEIVSDEETVPFANTTFFDTDTSFALESADNVITLKDELDSKVHEMGDNRFYIALIEGSFHEMEVRSELPQTEPYKPLAAVLETDQTFFDYQDISGTVVGLYCPAYMNSINAVGWHFHFVSDDRTKGGHVLDLSAGDLAVRIDKTDRFSMVIPDNELFNGFDLSIDQSEDIKKVETGEDREVSGSTAPRRPEDELEVMLPSQQYELIKSTEVNGRQGVCSEGDYYWVSGSATLSKYDKDWNLIAVNDDPFKGYPLEVNHIGDIDVYEHELYVGAEYFMDGVGKNIQIAVYDGDTLELKRTLPFEPASGQLECSGIAVVPDTKTVWMCSWVGEESGRYLYKYDLDTGAYLGKIHLQMPPQWLQGIAYYDGWLYMTADDGTADDNEPDHLYRTRIDDAASGCTVTLERTFDDVTRQGEIEGLTFDKERGQLLVLYNRGARIVLGMPKGFYDGYDREISEVFTYTMSADR